MYRKDSNKKKKENIATQLSLAGQARTRQKHLVGMNGIPREGCSIGRGPEVRRSGHGWGWQVGLVGEHGKSRRVMGNNLTWAVTGLRC